jgi:putative tryptophan/tyrosine transport system substrate-binding protein
MVTPEQSRPERRLAAILAVGMRRREFIALLGIAWPLAARAQQPGKVPRMGFLSAGFPPANPAFWRAMHDLGYVEGGNILVEYGWAEGKPERLPELVTELDRRKVDVIFIFGHQAALAAKSAHITTPVVFLIHADPIEAGLVGSLARPGGNFSGVTMLAPDLAGKRLALLKEVVPATPGRVAVLVNTANPGDQATVSRLEAAAQPLETALQILEARTLQQVEDSFVAMAAGRARALYVALDPLFLEHRTRIVELAAKYQLPAMYDVKEFVAAGGLMSYGPDIPDLFSRGAYFVDRILKGTKPADLPVEQPTLFKLVINLKTAKALGLTIPATVLARADEVID